MLALKWRQIRTNSPAAEAGLRNGDILTQSLDLNPSYKSFRDAITLHVLRDKLQKTVTYNPHSGSYPGMKWTLSLRESLTTSCHGPSQPNR